MARYQIMYWKDIPAQVKAVDEVGTFKVMLPNRFSEAIDMAAMAEGSIDTDAYLSGWAWGPEEERAGSAQEVAEQVAAELEAAYPPERLAAMIRTRNT